GLLRAVRVRADRERLPPGRGDRCRARRVTRPLRDRGRGARAAPRARRLSRRRRARRARARAAPDRLLRARSRGGVPSVLQPASHFERGSGRDAGAARARALRAAGAANGARPRGRRGAGTDVRRGGMAKDGRVGLRLWDRLVLLVAWLVTCGLVYLLGFYVGKGTQERRPVIDSRLVRLPVTSTPPPEGP